jgi:toxin YhaV
MPESSPLVINGWEVYMHPLFLDQFEAVKAAVRVQKKRDPRHYQRKPANKRLIAIMRLVFEVIPQDPTRPEYRQGNTLGVEYKHWFRAKFFQQYRLFFRYHTERKIIVLAWVNDESTKRAYESPSDAYRVFKRMLHSGHPPDSWDELLAESQREIGRMAGLMGLSSDSIHDT